MCFSEYLIESMLSFPFFWIELMLLRLIYVFFRVFKREYVEFSIFLAKIDATEADLCVFPSI